MKQCRICFDDSDQPNLISPCKCKGSQKWVHIECLNMWRAQSQQSFYKCPTCKYEYRVERLQWARYVQNPISITILTILVILSIILFVAYFLNFFLWILGSGVVQNAWQISRQVLWWATLAIGMVAFIFLTEKENLSFFDFNFYSTTGIVYSASFMGLFSLFYILYNGIRYYCMQLLNSLGERILQVNPDDNDHDKED